MIESAKTFMNEKVCPAFESIGTGIKKAASTAQQGVAKVYGYGLLLDKKVVDWTNTHLPRPAAIAAQVFFRLSPYIIMAVALPFPVSACASLGLLALKGIATKGKYFDMAGQISRIGTIQLIASTRLLCIGASAGAAAPVVVGLAFGALSALTLAMCVKVKMRELAREQAANIART